MGGIKAIILIGGPQKGTRFRPLSFQVPKPVFPIAGFPMVQHQIEACAKLAECREVLLLGYFQPWQELKTFLKAVQKDYSLSVRYLQEYCPLGTAGGLYHFRDQIQRGDPSAFFVFNSDVHCDFPLEEMLRTQQDRTGGKGHVILGCGASDSQAPSYGCIVHNQDTAEVTHYVEKPESYVSSTINAGVYLFASSIFENFKQALQANFDTDSAHLAPDSICLERGVLPKLANTGTFFVYLLPRGNNWCQIKNGGSALYANRLYLSLYRKYNADRLSGAGEGRPRIVGDVQVHPSAQVHPTAVLGPNVYVGSGVVIRPGVRVRESIILDRAELKEHCCVLHSIIGWDCVVGEWSRVEGYPNYPDPNDPFALVAVDSLFNDRGQLNPSITILGEGVAVPGGTMVLNSIVLPHKELACSYRNQIIL